MRRLLPLLLVACSSEPEPVTPIDAKGAAQAFQLGRGQQIAYANGGGPDTLTLAIEELEKAARLDVTRADYHYQAGRAREERGDLPEARGHFIRTVTTDAQHREGHERLASLLRQEGQLEGAAEHAKIAIELGAGASASVIMGQVREDEGDFHGARHHYRKAVDLIEPTTDAWFRLSHVERELGNDDAAEEALTRYQELFAIEGELRAARKAASDIPGDPRIHLRVAQLAWQLRLDGMVRSSCHKVLALAPGEPEATRLLAEVGE